MNSALLNETVYLDLQAAARRLFAYERPGHTLQPEALVHEALIRLATATETRWAEPAHFQAAAWRQMRFVLIDQGRRDLTQKHGANRRVSLSEALSTPAEPAGLHFDLNHALGRLRREFPSAARVVELKFFSGMTDPEMADALRCSTRTVRRQWRFARSWLRGRIG
jgi:RNA polymerase sigma factor (TIGR02999 family)